MVKNSEKELTGYAACAETARIDAVTCGFPYRFTAAFFFSRIKRSTDGQASVQVEDVKTVYSYSFVYRKSPINPHLLPNRKAKIRITHTFLHFSTNSSKKP